MTTDPVTRSVEIPEAAVEAAAQAYMDTRFAGARFIVTPKNAEGMRAALSAALPYLAPAEPACRCSVDVSTEQGIPDRLVADGDCPTHGEPAGDGGLREALLYVLTKWGVGGWKYEDAEGYRERVCNSLMVALAARPAAPADPEDTRTEEERGFVEEALAAADSGDAGHWPTVAGYLADEVRRLRAAPAGDASGEPIVYEYHHRSPKEPYFGTDWDDGWRRNNEEAAINLRDEHGHEVRRRRVTGWEAVTEEVVKP